MKSMETAAERKTGAEGMFVEQIIEMEVERLKDFRDHPFSVVDDDEIRDAVMWHVVPLIVITVLAEAARGMTGYSRTGDFIGTVLMSFSSFGYYGQIWFNRAYTYECAVEEMPAGYGDTLMSVSPAWAFPVVVIVGMIVSVWIANVSMKKHKGIEKSER